jgi:riboflavin synthase
VFTGIIEELGTVRRITHHDGGARVEITAHHVLDDAEIGASISVNGCCLTVVELGPDWWAADAVTETLDRTCLGSLRIGDAVNLERPVRLSDRLGGHIVQGHVDAVGTIVGKQPMGDGSMRVDVAAPLEVMRYVVEKGSITVDGISLTVAARHDDTFSIAVIPHTLAVTTLGPKEPNDPVNLEVDVVAKYVERLMETPAACPNEEPAACPNEEPAACPNATRAES